LSQNISQEEVEVDTTKDSQLHLLIDTPTAKIWRESSDLAELTPTWPSSVPKVGKGRRNFIPKRHRHRHDFVDVVEEQNHKEN